MPLWLLIPSKTRSGILSKTLGGPGLLTWQLFHLHFLYACLASSPAVGTRWASLPAAPPQVHSFRKLPWHSGQPRGSPFCTSEGFSPFLSLAFIPCFFNRLFFFFRADLGSQQNWAEGTETPCILPAPHYQHPHQTVLLLKVTIAQGPWFMSEFTLGVVPSVDLERCVTCDHHYSIQNSFLNVKSSVLYLFCPHSSLVPGNHWCFHYLYSFAFSRISYSWNHTVLSVFRSTSFT